MKRPPLLIASLAILLTACIGSLQARGQEAPDSVREVRVLTYLNAPNHDLVKISEVTKAYDGQGELIEEKHRFNGETVKWERHVVKDGRRTSTLHFSDLGQEVARSEYAYDDEMRLSTIEKKDAMGDLLLRTSYTYTPSGQVAEYLRYDADSSTFMHASYHYDAKGNLVGTRWYDKENVARTIFEYDRNSRLPKELEGGLTGIGLEENNVLYHVGRNKVRVYRKDNSGKFRKGMVIGLSKDREIDSITQLKGRQEIPGLEPGQRREVEYDSRGRISTILRFSDDRLESIQKFIYSYEAEE